MAKINGKVLALIVIFGILLHMNNVSRSVSGFDSWYSDPVLITQGLIYYVIFFGLISGYIITKISKNK